MFRARTLQRTHVETLLTPRSSIRLHSCAWLHFKTQTDADVKAAGTLTLRIKGFGLTDGVNSWGHRRSRCSWAASERRWNEGIPLVFTFLNCSVCSCALPWAWPASEVAASTGDTPYRKTSSRSLCGRPLSTAYDRHRQTGLRNNLQIMRKLRRKKQRGTF